MSEANEHEGLYDTAPVDFSNTVSEDTVEQMADNVVEIPLSPKCPNYWLMMGRW